MAFTDNIETCITAKHRKGWGPVKSCEYLLDGALQYAKDGQFRGTGEQDLGYLIKNPDVDSPDDLSDIVALFQNAEESLYQYASLSREKIRATFVRAWKHWLEKNREEIVALRKEIHERKAALRERIHGTLQT